MVPFCQNCHTHRARNYLVRRERQIIPSSVVIRHTNYCEFLKCLNIYAYCWKNIGGETAGDNPYYYVSPHYPWAVLLLLLIINNGTSVWYLHFNCTYYWYRGVPDWYQSNVGRQQDSHSVKANKMSKNNLSITGNRYAALRGVTLIKFNEGHRPLCSRWP